MENTRVGVKMPDSGVPPAVEGWETRVIVGVAVAVAVRVGVGVKVGEADGVSLTVGVGVRVGKVADSLAVKAG